MDEKTEIDIRSATRLIRLPEVLKIVAMGKTRLYAKVADGSFPKPIRLSERQVRWALKDVVGWVESLSPRERFQASGPRPASDQSIPNQRHCRRSTDRPAHFVIRRGGDRRRG